MRNLKKVLAMGIGTTLLFTSATAMAKTPRYDENGELCGYDYSIDDFNWEKLHDIIENGYHPDSDKEVSVVVGVELASGELVEVEVGGKVVYVDEHMYVPLRLCAEAAEYNVGWDDATSGITLSDENMTIKLQLDEQIIEKNGETVELTSPVLLIDDVTYVCDRDLDTVLTRYMD